MELQKNRLQPPFRPKKKHWLSCMHITMHAKIRANVFKLFLSYTFMMTILQASFFIVFTVVVVMRACVFTVAYTLACDYARLYVFLNCLLVKLLANHSWFATLLAKLVVWETVFDNLNESTKHQHTLIKNRPKGVRVCLSKVSCLSISTLANINVSGYSP